MLARRWPIYATAMRLMILTCLAMLTSTSVLCGAESSGCFFNPQLSSRSIALNEAVLVNFTTMQPQIKSVDIERSLRQSLSVGSVTRDWRLTGIIIVTHEKAGDVQVSLTLLPRRTGPLPLPSIAVDWLEGEHRPSFGSIEVRRALQVASEDADLPLEVRGIAGFPWGMTRAEAATQLQQPELARGTGPMQPAPGLELHFEQGTFGKAVLRQTGISTRSRSVPIHQTLGNPFQCDMGCAATADSDAVVYRLDSY